MPSKMIGPYRNYSDRHIRMYLEGRATFPNWGGAVAGKDAVRHREPVPVWRTS